ncbi:hypothetical protein [Acidicapsa ligni]|uniref:hypothetical protein n=1 Tax=Acidicapsa ligni TaxID=542300 RepID=UPI0021E06BA0|nr:hypothetical protein [Acidicapsa ligni]
MIWFFAVVTITLPAQSAVDTARFTSDEIAIYRNFLLHYPEQLSNMIGMQDTTVAFKTSTGFLEQPGLPNLAIPSYSGRKLPPEIMALTSEREVTARIVAEGKLIEAGKRSPSQGPDGYVRTHLTLSEIAFDSKHEEAAFIFYASCGCLGGQGGMAVYERKNGRWKLKTMLNVLEG